MFKSEIEAFIGLTHPKIKHRLNNQDNRNLVSNLFRDFDHLFGVSNECNFVRCICDYTNNSVQDIQSDEVKATFVMFRVDRVYEIVCNRYIGRYEVTFGRYNTYIHEILV